MAKVEIYTSPLCGYCSRAKTLLEAKGATYTEFDISKQPERRGEMMARAKGGRTVPQIFIDGVHIGGSDDLMALERKGELSALLKSA